MIIDVLNYGLASWSNRRSNRKMVHGLEYYSEVRMQEIQVSVVCNAYNHEAYIRDALEGFVKQKTSFAYEVLVHDDASTDKTADIIRQYEKNYPKLIKPIYETENQYSKKDGSLSRIQYGRVKGRYIALCEGDDYWTDPYKLQKQFDVLEKHPEIDICATAAETETNGKITGKCAPSNVDTIFTVEEVISGGGEFVATASLMCRAEIRKSPHPFLQMMPLDYLMQISGALRGGMLFMSEPMCVYRVATPGSWTVCTLKSREAQNDHKERVKRSLQCLDNATSGKYHDIIDQKIKERDFKGFIGNYDFDSVLLPEYRKWYVELPTFKRIMIRIGKRCPQLVRPVWDFYRKVK